MFKRILLFLAVNFLVVTVISILLSIFNIRPYIQSFGLNYGELMLFCLIWGFGGAFISLGLSRWMAKLMFRIEVIPPNTSDHHCAALIEKVYRLSREAKLPVMPEVGMYESPEVNAFATGPSRRRSLVAVSTGLLNRVSNDELEGVLAHEIAHVANGDMVTMTLVQGVMNAFVMFLARVLAFFCSGMGQNRRYSSTLLYGILIFVFQTIFMTLGFMVVAAYSRFREFRADKGGAKLAGTSKMIAALEALQKTRNLQDADLKNPAFQAFKISNRESLGLFRFFSTHPPIEIRIQRLKETV